MSGISLKETHDNVRMLTLVVKALIETHPDKEALHKQILAYTDKPEAAGDHFSGLGQSDFDRSLLASLLQSAAKK